MSGIFGGFGSSSSSPSAPSSVPSGVSPSEEMQTKKKAVMEQIHNELALSNAQELINKINEKCFLKCVTKPSTSLSGSEETCLSRCMDRYMEAFNIVSRTYTERLRKEGSERSF